MKKSTELTLTNGQIVKLEVIEGESFNKFELSLTEENKSFVLCSLNLPKQDILVGDHQEIENHSTNKTSSIDDFLKERLDESIFELYQAVMDQPKLVDTFCSVALFKDSGREYEVIHEGSIKSCLLYALNAVEKHKVLDVWLPIGENTYSFAMFDCCEEEGVKQNSYLPKRIIELALPTVQEINEYEQDLIETGNFANEEIENAVAILSEKTYQERIANEGLYTLFEDIASDLYSFSSPQEAIEELMFNTPLDLNVKRNKLRLKGLIHFANQKTVE